MKNIILVTGGAGFIGTNMISLLLKKTNYKIISLDNYSSETKSHKKQKSPILYWKHDRYRKYFKI